MFRETDEWSEGKLPPRHYKRVYRHVTIWRNYGVTRACNHVFEGNIGAAEELLTELYC